MNDFNSNLSGNAGPDSYNMLIKEASILSFSPKQTAISNPENFTPAPLSGMYQSFEGDFMYNESMYCNDDFEEDDVNDKKSSICFQCGEVFDTPATRHEHQIVTRHSQDSLFRKKFLEEVNIGGSGATGIPTGMHPIDINAFVSYRPKPNYTDRLVCFQCGLKFETPQQRHEHQKISRHAHNYYDKVLLENQLHSEGTPNNGAVNGNVDILDEKRICFECNSKFDTPQLRHLHQETTKHARSLLEYHRKLEKSRKPIPTHTGYSPSFAPNFSSPNYFPNPNTNTYYNPRQANNYIYNPSVGPNYHSSMVFSEVINDIHTVADHNIYSQNGYSKQYPYVETKLVPQKFQQSGFSENHRVPAQLQLPQISKNLFINQNSPFSNSASDLTSVPNAWSSTSNGKFQSLNVAPMQMRDSPNPQPSSGSGYYTPNSSISTFPYNSYQGQGNSNFSTPAHTAHPMQGSHFSPNMQPDVGMFQKQNLRDYNATQNVNSVQNRQGLSNISYSSSITNSGNNRNPFTSDNSIEPNSNTYEFTQRANYNNFAAPFTTGPFNPHNGMDSHNARLISGHKDMSRGFNSQQDHSFNTTTRSFNQLNSQIGGTNVNKDFSFNSLDLSQSNTFNPNFNDNSKNDPRLSLNEPFHKNEVYGHSVERYPPKYGNDTSSMVHDKKLSLFESDPQSTNQLDLSVFPTRFNTSGQSVNFV